MELIDSFILKKSQITWILFFLVMIWGSIAECKAQGKSVIPVFNKAVFSPNLSSSPVKNIQSLQEVKDLEKLKSDFYSINEKSKELKKLLSDSTFYAQHKDSINAVVKSHLEDQQQLIQEQASNLSDGIEQNMGINQDDLIPSNLNDIHTAYDYKVLFEKLDAADLDFQQQMKEMLPELFQMEQLEGKLSDLIDANNGVQTIPQDQISLKTLQDKGLAKKIGEKVNYDELSKQKQKYSKVEDSRDLWKGTEKKNSLKSYKFSHRIEFGLGGSFERGKLSRIQPSLQLGYAINRNFLVGSGFHIHNFQSSETSFFQNYSLWLNHRLNKVFFVEARYLGLMNSKIKPDRDNQGNKYELGIGTNAMLFKNLKMRSIAYFQTHEFELNQFTLGGRLILIYRKF
ncbi:hypothetical protein MM239_20520 [Belliella sp. DSM 111904]|uniref:Outer membrane protein beta-barrel domain-containing protein n=1 Tax=Belliella filtrata TaxID=2923435 RepID=A0ABS9V5V0_9BACT|nr:hypothetical protein [Belliella filtrata]MCH7411783.1 hypothetical protein [Belliella filtrata]